jgi:phosphoserine phosphatase RsbU/P
MSAVPQAGTSDFSAAPGLADFPKHLPETAVELIISDRHIGPDQLNASAIAIFQAEADLKGLVVVEKTVPLGLINRNEFFAVFAKPFSRELYLKRKCSEFMDTQPLIVDGNMQISEVGSLVAQRGEKALADGFIITVDGKFHGLCDGITLLRALSELQDDQHRQLLSSIDYAGTIQNALLADSRAALEDGMPSKYALLWEPRDIVGGDCFFAKRDERGILIGAIDCTGHGVPGALLTSIAISESNRLAFDDDTRRSPGAMINGLNRRVKAALQQEDASDLSNMRADDGMDAVFVYMDTVDELVKIASAKLPVFVFDHAGHLTTVKGTRKGVGYRETPTDFSWEEHVLKRSDIARIVIATDGLCDQIGEVRKIAFGWNRIREALTQGFSSTVGQQRDLLWHRFLEYQGKQMRRDDVTVICLDVTP